MIHTYSKNHRIPRFFSRNIAKYVTVPNPDWTIYAPHFSILLAVVKMHCLYANAVVQPSVLHYSCYMAWKTKDHTWCRCNLFQCKGYASVIYCKGFHHLGLIQLYTGLLRLLATLCNAFIVKLSCAKIMLLLFIVLATYIYLPCFGLIDSFVGLLVLHQFTDTTQSFCTMLPPRRSSWSLFFCLCFPVQWI